MGKALSMDLRERIVRYWEAGASRRQAAKVFRVAPSVAIKLIDRYERTGDFSPGKAGGDRRSKLKEHGQWLLEQVARMPDVTLSELAAALQGRGVSINASNISRFLTASGLSYKKNASGKRTRSP